MKEKLPKVLSWKRRLLDLVCQFIRLLLIVVVVVPMGVVYMICVFFQTIAEYIHEAMDSFVRSAAVVLQPKTWNRIEELVEENKQLRHVNDFLNIRLSEERGTQPSDMAIDT